MACEGTSDQRIGENLIKKVIEEQLQEVSTEEVPPLVLPSEIQEVKNELERKMVTQLAVMIKTIGDRLKDDYVLNDAIDGVVDLNNEAKHVNYWQIVQKVFDDGQITWERIAVLFYVAGRMAVKMVMARLPRSVLDILRWTVECFRNKLLGWIREHGGWINSFSELALSPVVRSVSFMSPENSGYLLMFFVGVTLGAFIALTMTRRT